MNWNGVVSPDGTEIAFLSMVVDNFGNPTGSVDLYTIPVNGGDPVKIDNHPFEFGRYRAGPCQLIDWR